MSLLADAPPGVPSRVEVMARAGSENFPVASRALPARSRAHLMALYGFARLVDELGDGGQDAPTERLAALGWLQDELERAYAGHARHPLLVGLQPTLRACALPREPFLRLIEANRVDQSVARYETWEQLLGYCELSANPVGELVLGVFGKATPERVALSDRICTALQLAEHWQDVAEDFARGRIYLPREDRARFGCEESELAGPPQDLDGGVEASWRLCGLLAFEVARTRALLAEGLPLIETLRGRERLAVAAFAGGARAALDAIERSGYDVLAGAPRASRPRRLAVTAALLAGRRR
ncbi:MAG TPA: squalene synthase HpnC [Solirubrobacteraceae bacterium]|jgi:squalene synthase HpnC